MNPQTKQPHVLHHADLWRAYNADPDNTRLRDELAELYTGWVWKLADYFRRTRSKRYGRDELFSVGFLQMLKLMRSFRADGGANFIGYSKLSILGAMTQLDVDHMAAFAARHTILSTQSRESQSRGRRINDFELAQALGITEGDLWRRIQYARRAIGGTMDEQQAAEIPARQSDHERELDLRVIVEDAVAQLPPRWRTVLHLHYFEGLTMPDIANSLAVSPQAISLTIGSARQRLAAFLPKSVLDLLPAPRKWRGV